MNVHSYIFTLKRGDKMFQNVTDEEVQDDFEDVEVNNNTNKKLLKIKELFSVQNIILYAVSFMVSMVSFNGNFAPFGLAIFAAVCSNRIAARSCIHSMFSAAHSYHLG